MVGGRHFPIPALLARFFFFFLLRPAKTPRPELASNSFPSAPAFPNPLVVPSYPHRAELVGYPGRLVRVCRDQGRAKKSFSREGGTKVFFLPARSSLGQPARPVSKISFFWIFLLAPMAGGKNRNDRPHASHVAGGWNPAWQI